MRIFLVLLLAFFLPCKVFAQSYELRVKQINPSGWEYSGKCEIENFCHVFMGAVPQNETYNTNDIELDVGVFLTKEKAYFQFKSGRDYFFTSEDDKTLSLDMELHGTLSKTLKILKKSPTAENDPYGSAYKLLVFRPPSKVVAELEIEIERE